MFSRVAALGLLLTTANALPNNYGSSKRDDQAACEALWQLAPQKLANLTIGAVEYKLAGSNFTDWRVTLDGIGGAPIFNLPAHCRFAANITTSSMSKVDMEVFLPLTDAWK